MAIIYSEKPGFSGIGIAQSFEKLKQKLENLEMEEGRAFMTSILRTNEPKR